MKRLLLACTLALAAGCSSVDIPEGADLTPRSGRWAFTPERVSDPGWRTIAGDAARILTRVTFSLHGETIVTQLGPDGAVAPPRGMAPAFALLTHKSARWEKGRCHFLYQAAPPPMTAGEVWDVDVALSFLSDSAMKGRASFVNQPPKPAPVPAGQKPAPAPSPIKGQTTVMARFLGD